MQSAEPTLNICSQSSTFAYMKPNITTSRWETNCYLQISLLVKLLHFGTHGIGVTAWILFSSQSLFRSAKDVALPCIILPNKGFLMAECNLFQIGIMRRRWRQIQCAQVFILIYPGLVYFNTHIMHTTYMYLCAEQWEITHKCDFVTINVLAKT